jgi:group I intron endonuclease
MNVYCIYFPNGKRYVGTENQHGRRIKCHANLWDKNNRNVPLVTRAIAKHGWENCQWRYFATNATAEDGYALEKFFIKTLSLQNPKIGYNISSGGANGSLGVKRTEDQKKRIADKLRGRKLPAELRARLSVIGSRPKPWLRGKPNWRRMPVHCHQTDEIFASATEAAAAVGLKYPAHICSCCKGKRPHAAGFTWSYLTNPIHAN